MCLSLCYEPYRWEQKESDSEELNTVQQHGGEGRWAPDSWKSTYSFCFSKNLVTNSPRLTGNLTDNINSRLTRILYVIGII